MLEAGADPNTLDINNKTPLYYLEYSENITLPNNSKSECLDQGILIYTGYINLVWMKNVINYTY
jgi:hypothetical protein